MSKELEALKELKHWKETNNENGVVWLPLFAVEDIEKALNELQAIKNANPTEALEDLKELHKLAYDIDVWKIEDIVQSSHIKQALLKAQEQGKVLNVIIKKNVSVWGFRNRVFGYQKEQNGNRIINDTYEYYLNNFGCYHNGFDIELLTEEEFNILKEYFKWME